MSELREMIPVDCAVNDDHGAVSGKAHALHFPGLELSAIDIRGVNFKEVKRPGYMSLRIGRREWPARHVRSCVGNLYWERYEMEALNAAVLLHWLRREKRFTLDSGFEELATWWDSSISDERHVARHLLDAAKDERF